MELEARSRSIAEVQRRNLVLSWTTAGLVLSVALLAARLVTQSQIVVLQTPGMPSAAVIEKSAMDKSTQMSTLMTVTSSIVQVNPANKEFQLRVLQSYLSPTAYTPVSQEINRRAHQLQIQHELGSYYFVMRSYQYDPALDRHFVLGDVHTVNAAVDSAVAYVYEYRAHIENYRLVVDEVTSYAGDRAHDSDWVKANQR